MHFIPLRQVLFRQINFTAWTIEASRLHSRDLYIYLTVPLKFHPWIYLMHISITVLSFAFNLLSPKPMEFTSKYLWTIVLNHGNKSCGRLLKCNIYSFKSLSDKQPVQFQPIHIYNVDISIQAGFHQCWPYVARVRGASVWSVSITLGTTTMERNGLATAPDPGHRFIHKMKMLKSLII